MAGLSVLRSGSPRKIHLNDLTLFNGSDKRPVVQTRMIGNKFFFLLVGVGNSSGFGSETQILQILGKNPVLRVREDIALGRGERLLEESAGTCPRTPTFTRFKLLTSKEAKEAALLLSQD